MILNGCLINNNNNHHHHHRHNERALNLKSIKGALNLIILWRSATIGCIIAIPYQLISSLLRTASNNEDTDGNNDRKYYAKPKTIFILRVCIYNINNID